MTNTLRYITTRIRFATFATCTLAIALPSVATSQWSTSYEQFYMPGSFNWAFRTTYPGADRLFNAFDYGHSILYERLYTQPGADASGLETDEYNFITKKLLVSPPHVPLEEAAIEVAYAKIAPEAKMMFDWAHLLHRQIYDVLASEAMSQRDKDATIEKLVRYYKTRPDLAFSSVPKSMDLMEGQPYSLAFRNGYPKFNGLIWAYHWLQVGLYEPMLTGKTLEEKQAGVAAAVARFRQMLEDAPEHMPRMMPMTAAIAPTFSQRYPEAAIIFDNLHSMHDVVSDILANPKVPHNRKRAEILLAASRYRDKTSFVTTKQEWMDMAQMMGIENMGGPAVGFLPGWMTPTIPRGQPASVAMASMRGMRRDSTGSATMPGMNMGTARADTTHGMSGMSGMSMTKRGTSDTTNMAGMNMSSDSMHTGMHSGDSTSQAAMMSHMHNLMMTDSVIRRRMMADTAMRRMMNSMMGSMPGGGHGMSGMSGMSGMETMGSMSMTLAHPKPAHAASKGRTTTTKKKGAKKTAATGKNPKSPPMTDMKGMSGMKDMPGMKKK